MFAPHYTYRVIPKIILTSLIGLVLLIAIGSQLRVQAQVLKAPHRQATAGWSIIKTEDFEGVFPNTLWTVVDLSDDNYERMWDDDNYKPHLGSWAGWPARGGFTPPSQANPVPFPYGWLLSTKGSGSSRK